MTKRPHTIVVGGTKGIGKAATRLLTADKHRITVIGRSTPSTDETTCQTTQSAAVDIQDKRQTRKCLQKIIAANGPINHLLFFQRFRGKGDDWQGEIAASLTATKEIIEYTADHFASTGERSIVIISSIAARFIAKEQPLSYHVGKAAINQLVRYYAVSLGEKGIRINSISPGTVLKEESRYFYQSHPELVNLYKKITPLGRMCTADEIARTVLFFCSDASSFITGQDLVVDGGISLQWHESLARRLSPLKALDVTQTRGE